MSKSKNVPAYLTFVFRAVSRAIALGMTVERDMAAKSTLPENSGYCFLRLDGGTASLIIPKHAGEVQWCDSHIDWSGEKGYIEHEGGGGAVMCRIDPTEVDLDAYLKRLSGAKKRDKKRASKAASESTAELLAKLQSLGLPVEEEPAPSATPEAPVVQESEDLGDFSELA